ncbi:VanZ family protein [Olleya sp. R77988]|uniref:VanZ family protein n=1 Tax=Olleya sp. R77988 TaxID=3093875 RepID=UPI0037CC5E1F
MRKLLPFASFGYSLLLLTVSLIKVKDVVELPENNDKVMHAIAYFIFTCIWFYTLNTYYRKSIKQAFKITIIASIVFGIIIEVLQHTTTQSRQADYKDIVANIIGTLVAVVVIKFITNLKVKN